MVFAYICQFCMLFLTFHANMDTHTPHLFNDAKRNVILSLPHALPLSLSLCVCVYLAVILYSILVPSDTWYISQAHTLTTVLFIWFSISERANSLTRWLACACTAQTDSRCQGKGWKKTRTHTRSNSRNSEHKHIAHHIPYNDSALRTTHRKQNKHFRKLWWSITVTN